MVIFDDFPVSSYLSKLALDTHSIRAKHGDANHGCASAKQLGFVKGTLAGGFQQYFSIPISSPEFLPRVLVAESNYSTRFPVASVQNLDPKFGSKIWIQRIQQ